MKKIYDIERDYLDYHYTKLGKSAKKICEELGIKSRTVIYRLLKKYNIKRRSGRTGVPQPNRLMYGEIPHSYYYTIKSRAKRKGQKFEVTGKYIGELYDTQEGKCAISGIELKLPKTWGAKTKTEMTASLDRIDSNIGYIIGNIHWVHKRINSMKMDMSIEEFRYYCKQVVNNDSDLS